MTKEQAHIEKLLDLYNITWIKTNDLKIVNDMLNPIIQERQENLIKLTKSRC